MTGRQGEDSQCPVCGGDLTPGVATVPFIFPETFVVVKDVPAEVCNSCHETYMAGKTVDQLTRVLNQLRSLRTEVSLISYPDIINMSPAVGA
ncbi:MAG: type II toxin-antitoxin system MqsA family antitoxin [SAR202 cluster bacterium]|nr:type II toxin-antitoxin system MqsA family antitoxin [SAR202 cluster bacterium]